MKRYAAFPAACVAQGIPEPVAEYRFHPVRRWRFDFAFPEYKIALEVDGGIWVRGRHNRGAGMQADMEKFNTAAGMGWRVLRATPANLYSAATFMHIRLALALAVDDSAGK